jgi:hypothetical protein
MRASPQRERADPILAKVLNERDDAILSIPSRAKEDPK